MRLPIFLVGLLASLLGPSAADASFDLEPVASGPPENASLDAGAGARPGTEGRRERAQPMAVALRLRSSARLSGVQRILDASRDSSSFALSPWDEVLLSAYAEEVSQSLGADAGASIAHLIGSLPPTERTWVIARWTLSTRDRLRLALARAAAHPLPAVGLYSALEQLARDPDPHVRETARTALAQRGLPPPQTRA